MQPLTGVFSEAFVSCFSCLMCWEPSIFRLNEKSRQFDDKEIFPVVSSQPTSPPRPMAVPGTQLPRPTWKHKVQKGFAPNKMSTKLRSDIASGKLNISAPFEFRHLDSGSFPISLPNQQLTQPWDTTSITSSSFEPLQLSIRRSGNEISPILPYFNSRSTMSSPASPHRPEQPLSSHPLPHQRSNSSNSFHIPRKQLPGGSPLNPRPDLGTEAPVKDKRRPRAYTTSDMDAITERVASAMNEVEEIQRKINEIIERQSLYTTSRPSTSHSVAPIKTNSESMPSIPALPPAAPSFAQRLNAEVERPAVAPIEASARLNRRKFSIEVSAANEKMLQSRQEDRLPPPPPLPLVLRPPLRKKKSFSRVSTWLFPEPGRSGGTNLDPVTNFPQPVKGKDGFYQTVSPGERSSRRSAESMGSLSTWESDDGNRTAPTALSPESTPAAKHGPLMESCSTLENNNYRPNRLSVGVAI